MKLLLSFLALSVVSCSISPKSNPGPEHYFATEVKPVLQQQCLRCHDGARPAPVMNLSSKETAFAKNAKGQPYIVPGSPEKSLMITAVQRIGTHPKLMPFTDVSLTDMQIGMLREWIEDGAYWPTGDAGKLRPQTSREHP